MSVVHLIETMTEWAQRNICDLIKLKQPPKNTEPNDSDYFYEEVNPVAFPMYVPSSEKLPPHIHSPFPSVCVRFLNGSDTLANSESSVDVQLCFSAWDPGIHGQDVFHPVGDGTFTRQGQVYTEYARSADGWRDVWNFVDIALRAVESVTNIGGYIIDRKTPIKFGPLVEQEAIADYFPFWFAWISFTVKHPLVRNIQDINHLL